MSSVTHILEGRDGHGNVWLACNRRRPRESNRVWVIGRAIILKGQGTDLVDCVRCRRAYSLQRSTGGEGSKG